MLRQSYLHADTLGILHVCMQKKEHSIIIKIMKMVKRILPGLQLQFDSTLVCVSGVCMGVCVCV